jgi:hypothetical protein
MRARGIRLFAAVAAALVTAVVPALAGAELKPWDQEEVTRLAKDLSEAVSNVRQITRKDPSKEGGRQMNARAAEEYLETLKALETACERIVRKLEAGEDLEKTTGVARRIGMLLRDAQTYGRKLLITQPESEAIEVAIAALDKISPYYSEKSPLMPNPLNP